MGVRTFVGSRSSSQCASFSDIGTDCRDDSTHVAGFPPTHEYVMNLTLLVAGEPTFSAWDSYLNGSAFADGLVGNLIEPNLVMYFPVNKSVHPHEYWTMVATPVPDMKGSREQSVWQRFQRVRCEDAGKSLETIQRCRLIGRAQYWDTFLVE